MPSTRNAPRRSLLGRLRRAPRGGSTPRGNTRGSTELRMRIGLILIAMVMSVFAGRLVQLQAIDPGGIAPRAYDNGAVKLTLPARRGEILDRNGIALASSVTGKMVIADPKQVPSEDAPALARAISKSLDVDYFSTLRRLRTKYTADGQESRFTVVARRVPATQAIEAVQELTADKWKGLYTEDDPFRDYPAGDVGANIVGFVGTDGPLAGFERTFDKRLSGKDGFSQYTVGNGVRVPLGDNTEQKPVNGQDLRTTLDRDLDWQAQKVLTQAIQDTNSISGFAIIQDVKTGEILAMADAPTYDPNHPGDSEPQDRGAPSATDPYEPGSVQKVLTSAALIDAGKVTPRTKIVVPPLLNRQDRSIKDYWAHNTLHLTLAGAIQKSSNIGIVRAADKLNQAELVDYLHRFGLGSQTGIGIDEESGGILTAPEAMTSQTKDRVAFGQSLAVTALQMTSAISTIANGGVRISPNLIQGLATTDSGKQVGTDTATATRVISANAARQVTQMMELVVDPEEGTAPAAAVPGYRVAGKTGTAQRVDTENGGYRGYTVSFAGFAPAENPRFTIYVALHTDSESATGGGTAAPAFRKLMSYTLQRYGVAPTKSQPARLPTTW